MSRGRKIAGIDEVGRGALAGPLYVAVVLVPKGMSFRKTGLPKLRDSKRLTALGREAWFDYIISDRRILWARTLVGYQTVDRLNVTRAANLAVGRLFLRLVNSHSGLATRANVFLDGGLYLDPKSLLASGHTLNPRTLVRGDEKINAIKLASIVAKVSRDRYMRKLHRKFPVYQFQKNKGYGTKTHLRAIKKHGPSPAHRLTFI